MLITAGCGISQITWPEWPTWPKYCRMLFDCEHVNVGAPAAGNWYILNSTMKAIANHEDSVTCVIVTWTNHEKLDLFVDSSNPIDDIRNFNSRNWILNWKGELTDSDKGWWPSSVSDDNYFKEAYRPWQNTIQHALTTFHCILQLEQFCKQRNIPLYNFMSYDLNLDYYRNDPDVSWIVKRINWDNWPTVEPLVYHYHHSKWFSFEITNQQGFIPVAGWHWEAFSTYFMPILKKHFILRNINTEKIEHAAMHITRKKFNEYSNILESKK